jgi:hypothetical protein
MGETFYSALGVAADADGEAIRRAYRDLVKECHPDVSDDPGAPERFKRLTVARDVLLDDTERALYDRVGHEAYVRRHVESDVWAPDRVPTDPEAEPEPGAEATRARGEAGVGGGTPVGGPTERMAWLGEHTRPGEARSTPAGSRGRHGGYASGVARDGHAWQQASSVYGRAETDTGDDRTALGRVAAGVRALGPWLPIHAVLIFSALATGWVTYSQANRVFALSVPAVVAGLLLFGLVVALSVFHLVSQLYT